MDFIQSLLPTIQHFHVIGYWVALVVALLETTIVIGFLLPGSTIILFMGAMAAKGYFDIGDLIWFVIIGAVIGDNINYFIGKKYGSRLFDKGFLFIKPSHFNKGAEFFKKYGSKSVFFGRLIPSIKEVLPLIAGTFGMKRLPFMIWNILGAIAWSFVWVLPGYFFAQSLGLAKIWLTRAGFFLIILITIFIIFYILKIIFVKKGKQFLLFIRSTSLSLKNTILNNEKIQRFTNKHKLFSLFIKNRLSKKKFTGLPLTLFSISLLYIFSLLGGLIESIINSEVIVFADVRVAKLLTIFRSTDLTHFFVWITLLGKWQVILIFTLGTIFILWLQKKQHYITPLLVSIVGSASFTYIGKIIFHRARPSVAIYTEHSFSFPSGHATIAIAFYGFISYILLKNTNNWKNKVNIFFTTIFLILLIGFSRLYLGVHYLSDVWGGYLVGFIWLIIAISLSEYFSYHKTTNIKTNRNKRLPTIIITTLSICLYVIFAFNYQLPISTTSKKSEIKTNNALAIFNTNQSKFTETLLGKKQEPINFLILAKNDQQLIHLLQKADFYLADNINKSSITKILKALLQKKSYLTPPITPNFWNTNVNDFGFEKVVINNKIKSKYNVRIWKTNYITKNKYGIYVGTVSLSKNTKWEITHKIDPKIDIAREFLFNQLNKTGNIMDIKKIQFTKPSNNSYNSLFFTDGKLYLFTIKQKI